MRIFKSRTPRWIIIVVDLLINLFALLFAYVIRFDLDSQSVLIQEEWDKFSNYIWLFIAVKFLVFYSFQIHKGLIRHTSTQDLNRIFFAVSTCSLIYLSFGVVRYYFVDGYYFMPTSVVIVEFLASFSFTVGSRFVIKLIYLESLKSKEEYENIVIYGAGVSGLITKKTIQNDTINNQKVICYIDDNSKLWDTRIEGVKVYGPNELNNLYKKHNIDTLL